MLSGDASAPIRREGEAAKLRVEFDMTKTGPRRPQEAPEHKLFAARQ